MQQKAKSKQSKVKASPPGSHTTANNVIQERKIPKRTKSFSVCLPVFILLFIFSPHSALAQYPQQDAGERLFSPSVAQKFHEIAYEMAQNLHQNRYEAKNSKPETILVEELKNKQQLSQTNIHDAAIEQAVILLAATTDLDRSANYVHPDIINLACQHSERDYSQLLYQLLFEYADKSADLEVTTKAIQYLLEQLNSREEREKLLEEMLKTLGGKSPYLDSELATLLGLLTAEKADTKAAVFYFIQAYHSNKYNRLAFAKLTELAGEQIEPPMHLERLRLALAENPLDIQVAFDYAQYLEQLQLYETAADAFEYCADLFRFLYPSEALPVELYLSQAVSYYNTKRNQHRCLQIADELHQSGRFNLPLEAIAGKTAAKLGDTKKANQIFKAAVYKALVNHKAAIESRKSQIASQLAWFYCLVQPDADKALDWANKAYSTEPDSTATAATLAYALVMNEQTDWAKMIIDNYEKNPIANLTLAQIQIKQGKQDSAIESLKSAIALDPSSLEAELAKEILAQQGGEYIPSIDPDIILTTLRNNFGQTVVPTFTRPEEIVSVELNVRGSKFSYGNKFGGSVIITNNSSQPLIISDNSLLNGRFRIDVDISGDLNKKIPNLISTRIRPASPIKPGDSLIVPLRLLTAELRETLLNYPQASLNIEFMLYIDPVTTAKGELTNTLLGIKPARVLVKRPGIKLTGKYLRNRFDALTKGRQGQKIKTARLFAGLLAEQHVMANSEPLYKFMYADWMPDMLKSALLHNLADEDWVVKVYTMAEMLTMPLDYELTNAAAENLNDTHWPTRLMALFLLSKSQGDNFNKVLDWTAQYDSNGFVRSMAVALGGAAPQPQKPANQPATAD